MRAVGNWPAMKTAQKEQESRLRFREEMIPEMCRTWAASLRELQAVRYQDIEWGPIEQMDLSNHGNGADWDVAKQLLDRLIASPRLETHVGSALANRMGDIWNSMLRKPPGDRHIAWADLVMPPYEHMEEERRLLARVVHATTNDIYNPTLVVLMLIVMNRFYPIFLQIVDPAREFRGPAPIRGTGPAFAMF